MVGGGAAATRSSLSSGFGYEKADNSFAIGSYISLGGGRLIRIALG